MAGQVLTSRVQHKSNASWQNKAQEAATTVGLARPCPSFLVWQERLQDICLLWQLLERRLDFNSHL